MSTSSGDELPLIQRKIAKSIKKDATQRDQSSDSSLPSWMQTFGQEGEAKRNREQKRQVVLLDSDSDSEDVGTSQRMVKIGTQGSQAMDDVIDITESEPRGLDDSTRLEKEASRSQQGLVSQQDGRSKRETAYRKSSPEKTGDTKKALDAGMVGSLMTHADASQMAVVVPDKLPAAGSKLLLELECGDGVTGVTDLSGDSGAIGRILIRTTGEDGKERIELDLKGALYGMTPVEFPGTLMVLNIGAQDARVETIYDSFIQLREDKRFSDEGAMKLQEWLDEDMDDDVSLVPGEEAPAGNGGAKGRGQKGNVAKKPIAGKQQKRKLGPAKKNTALSAKKPIQKKAKKSAPKNKK